MSLLKLLFAFITISLASLAPAIEIDDDYEPKIKQMIETDREAYVMFHADWCGACKRFKPYYQQFASFMQEQDPVVPVLLVDNDQCPKLAARFQITYLPSLYHIRDGKVRNISNERGNLVEYVKEKQWEKLPPVNDHLSPYSIIGNLLAAVGVVGFELLALIKLVSAKTNIPVNFLTVAIAAFFITIVYFFLISLFQPKAVYVEVENRRAVKKSERSPEKSSKKED